MMAPETYFIQQVAADICRQLADVLKQLDDASYIKPSRQLSQATIGQHVRHIIELFQCLENGYEPGIVNYEMRRRDPDIEKNTGLATTLLLHMSSHLHQEDKCLILECSFGHNGHPVQVRSNYFRELIYNAEHAIHHMALIRVAIQEHTDMVLPEHFGVAPATLQYRRACAQ